ncbi:MAG TPA: hypothetical protein P5123_07515, partial [Spirochaetota bacterium]|nr:hypothetical protein [Spirochaetota bacterium]
MRFRAASPKNYHNYKTFTVFRVEVLCGFGRRARKTTITIKLSLSLEWKFYAVSGDSPKNYHNYKTFTVFRVEV